MVLQKHEACRLKSRQRASYLYKLETPPSFMAVNYTSPRMPSSTLFQSRSARFNAREQKGRVISFPAISYLLSNASKRVCRLRESYCNNIEHTRQSRFSSECKWRSGTTGRRGQTLFSYAQRTRVGKGFADHTCDNQPQLLQPLLSFIIFAVWGVSSITFRAANNYATPRCLDVIQRRGQKRKKGKKNKSN